MSKTAQMVLKIVAAGLAFAALVCLIVGSWQDMAKGCGCLKERLRQEERPPVEQFAAAPSMTTITTRSSISKESA